jgi:hypothetical protein
MAPDDPSGRRHGAQTSMSVALRPAPPLISLASAAEVHSEAADHTDPSSTVGSSPGVAEKRILGVFSFRTSDDGGGGDDHEEDD